MGPQTARLHELHERDRRLLDLRGREREILEAIRGGEARVEDEARGLVQAREELQQARAAVGSHELETQSVEDRIGRLKSQRLACRSNREYTAFTAEIQSLSGDRSRMDEEGLNLLGAVERCEAKTKALEGQLEADRAGLAAARERSARDLDGIRCEIEQVQVLRETCARVVSTEALELYERLLRSREGSALVDVTGGVCQGCYTRLTPQKVSDLMLGKDLVQCHSCARLLVGEAAVRGAAPTSP